jgi:hypothetical protein
LQYIAFCKHLFLRNTLSDTLVAADVEITTELLPRIKSAYESRTPNELSVLNRWIDVKDLIAPQKTAVWLDVILYSREQIRKENAGMRIAPFICRWCGNSNFHSCSAMGLTPVETDVPWGIISVKVQNERKELPMTPMTVMRNALGKEEGGSGIPLVREEYMKSVEYWKNHVFVRC